jgi:hypothetical protein
VGRVEIPVQRTEFLAYPRISGSRDGNSGPGENTTKEIQKSLEIGSAPTKFNARFTRPKTISKHAPFNEKRINPNESRTRA